MPRKQNGFGKAKSLAFKPSKNINKGKGVGAAGLYPSDRRYGSSVHRTIIEQYDLDSDWVKWRKGYEYYNTAAWYRLEELNSNTLDYEVSKIKSTLYEGTLYEMDVQFDGYKFPSSESDSNNHYVVKRTPLGIPVGGQSLDDPSSITIYRDIKLGTVDKSTIRNDFYYDFDYKNKEYLDYKGRKEIWLSINPEQDSNALTQMIGERITDGTTEASLTYLLNDKEQPCVYIGKTLTRDVTTDSKEIKSKLTTIDLEIPEASLTIEEAGVEYLAENRETILEMFVDKIIYIPRLFRLTQATDPNLKLKYIDSEYYFVVDVEDKQTVDSIEILDPKETALPPSLYDINDLNKLAKADLGVAAIEGNYVYKKDIYQRFFGTQYLTADVVKNEINFITYNILPYKVVGASYSNGNYRLKSIPAVTELKLYSDTPKTLIFTDYSFTKTVIDGYPVTNNSKSNDKYYYPNPDNPNQELEYYHKLDPKEDLWRRIDTSINPWMDEVFTSGNSLKPAVTYSYSCPNHSQSILSAPQETQDEGLRKRNRQQRYPLPTVLGKTDYDAIGINKAAGKIESWESREHKMSFKMCKHSIAVMFIERLKVEEPNSYPTIDARVAFEEKLAKEIDTLSDKFQASYERGGITTLEIIFALAQGLNLDEVETAYVVLNSNF